MIPVDPDKPVGPGNFKWMAKPSSLVDKRDKESVRAFQKKFREENPALVKENSLQWHFGISLVEYQEMLIKQRGVCAICGNPETDIRAGKVRALAVDHCHNSDKIPELLCGGCNKGLGNFKEDPQRLLNAIAYLKKHKPEADDDNVVPFTREG